MGKAGKEHGISGSNHWDHSLELGTVPHLLLEGTLSPFENKGTDNSHSSREEGHQFPLADIPEKAPLFYYQHHTYPVFLSGLLSMSNCPAFLPGCRK